MTYFILLKGGDDLQQDMLTLQLVRIIDKMWLKEGLDLKMVTFQCVSTGRNRSILKNTVVKNYH